MFVILKKHRSANCLFIHFFFLASLSIVSANGTIKTNIMNCIAIFAIPSICVFISEAAISSSK